MIFNFLVPRKPMFPHYQHILKIVQRVSLLLKFFYCNVEVIFCKESKTFIVDNILVKFFQNLEKNYW